MSEFKHIVRMAGRDLEGKKKVVVALADLRGVGPNLAYMILNALKIESRMRLGALTDEQIAEIESNLKDPSRIGVPSWALNRRRDLDTGSNFHLVGAELQMAVKEDIDREKDTASWRGVRHSLGLKVRGQRTRCTGRKGRTIGAKKTAVAPASAKE